MRGLKLKNNNFFADFEKLVARKDAGADKTELENMSHLIKTRYNEYQMKKKNPESVEKIKRTNKQEQALEKCYKNSTKFKMDLLCEDDRKPTPRCPYCQIDPARTWDHFLPSKKFPDYFVYAPNLIRVCSDCNPRKNNRRVHPIRETIHPYYDPMHDVRFLTCEIECANEITAIFSINPDTAAPQCNAYITGIVEAHFREYGLARKFQAEATREISDLKNSIRLIFKWSRLVPDQRYVDKHIVSKLNEAASEGKDFNCWEVAFWTGVRDCPDILTFILDEFEF